MERLDPLAKRQAKKASYKENAERREKPIPTKEQKDAEKRRELERKQAKYLIGQTRAAEIHDAKAVKSASVREDTLRRKLAKAARYALKKTANPGPAPGALLPAAPVVPQAAAPLVPPPAAPVAAPSPAPGALLPAAPVVPQAAAPLVPPPAAPVAAPPADDGDFFLHMFDEALDVEGK